MYFQYYSFLYGHTSLDTKYHLKWKFINYLPTFKIKFLYFYMIFFICKSKNKKYQMPHLKISDIIHFI